MKESQIGEIVLIKIFVFTKTFSVMVIIIVHLGNYYYLTILYSVFLINYFLQCGRNDRSMR